MLIKNQTKKLQRQNIFKFPFSGAVLCAFIFGSFCGGISKSYAQPATNQKQIQARQFANDLGEELAKSSAQNYKKLKEEIEQLRKYNEQLELKSKELYLKLEQQKEQIRDNQSLNTAFKKANAERMLLRQQKQDLIKEINENLKQSRIKQASLYDEQALICIKAKLFDLAITAYENSLKLNPLNAQTHYTLGLLYNQVYQDRKKALLHMKEYLKLSPQAKDKKEAQYMVDMLSQDLY